MTKKIREQVSEIMAKARSVTMRTMQDKGYGDPEFATFLAIQEIVGVLDGRYPHRIKTLEFLDLANLFFDELAAIKVGYDEAGIVESDVDGRGA